MGVDSDGKLCFGVQLKSLDDDEEIYFWHKENDEDFDSDSWLAEEYGDDYLSRPVEIVRHRSWSCTKYILALKGSTTVASRGWPESIDPSEMLRIETEGRQVILDFCAKYRIPCNPTDVRWWLCSMYG